MISVQAVRLRELPHEVVGQLQDGGAAFDLEGAFGR
jgi:hypothetical protein